MDPTPNTSTPPPQPSSTGEPQPQLSEMPKIENYLYPTTPSSFSEFQKKIEHIFTTMKNKIESSTPGESLLITHPQFQFINSTYFSPLFTLTQSLPSAPQTYSLIIDLKSFIHYVANETELKQLTAINPINVDTISTLYTSLKDKGTLIMLFDFQYITQLSTALAQLQSSSSSLFNCKLFIKLYVIQQLPFMTLLVIQKMSTMKEPLQLQILKEKLLLYELYDDFSMAKPECYTFETLSKVLTYMYEMYQYHAYLQELHPGMAIPIKIKETFYSDNIDFTVTIVDSADKELQQLNKCVAIIVNKTYAHDFLYLSIEGNMALCKQVQASRIMLIRPSPFNFDTSQVIKDKMSQYILMFKFKHCETTSIPVMMINEDNGEYHVIKETPELIIQDVIENKKKETYRQLVFKSSPHEIQCEIKLLLTSKTKIKNDNNLINYIQLPTCSKFANKNLVSCLDDSYLSMFYIKTILTGLFFADLETFPQQAIKVLILGAGIGTINYFYNKILKGNVEITAVEISKNIAQLGKEYFGINNYDNERDNIKWHFMDATTYLTVKETKCNYYDFVIIDINNTNGNDGISPPPSFFEDEVLSKIHSVIKDSGMYIINLMARSYKNYMDAFCKLEKLFPLLFLIENNEDLNQIHFCFKTKLGEDVYHKRHVKNLVKLKDKDVADIDVIEKEHGSIMARIKDTEIFKRNMQTNLV